MPLFKRFAKTEKADPVKDEEEEEDEEQEEVAVQEAEADAGAEEEEEGEEDEEEEGGSRLVLPTVPQDWAERLQVTSQKSLTKGEWNADDDTLREKLFEEQALVSVETALGLLKQHRIPNVRPADYYAQMIKSDVHMAKIRETMEYQRSRIKAQQERREQKHAQKFGKAVQNKVLADRQEEKAKSLARIEQLKKKSKSQGMAAAGEKEEIDVAFGGDDDDGGKKQPSKRKRSLTPGQSKPRKAKGKR